VFGAKNPSVPEDSFRNEFARVSEWIDAYLQHPERYAVFPRVAPGEIEAALPPHAPEEGEAFDAIFDDFERIVLPGITHWNHPRFFAYFATSAAPEAIAAEALAATLDVKVMLWRTSPAAAELESVVMRWLGRLLGVPDDWTGIIYDTASVGGFTALAAAREALGLGIRELGASGRDVPRLRVYATEHTHSHIEKAAIALGVGLENVVKVPCDAQFRMRPDELHRAIDEDRAEGMRPMAIVATIGTTSSTSIDPVPQIADVAKRHGIWLHVDAAYAGVAAIMPEFRYVMNGVELADSLVVNPHKWLFVPMDCSALYVRDEAMLLRAFSITPEYILTAPERNVRHYMEYGIQLGRRFRALKLWFVLRHFGAEGLRAQLRRHIELANEFAAWVGAEPNWELLAPHPFSVVCFRYKSDAMDEEEAERFNAALLEAVNATGDVFLSHTKLDGTYSLRLAVGNLRTQRSDVEAAWTLLRAKAKSA
jgi:aromatic-L-amino-acid/L-tryptophan decarboxylase